MAKLGAGSGRAHGINRRQVAAYSPDTSFSSHAKSVSLDEETVPFIFFAKTPFGDDQRVDLRAGLTGLYMPLVRFV
jgi:hypothetical protein